MGSTTAQLEKSFFKEKYDKITRSIDAPVNQIIQNKYKGNLKSRTDALV